MGKLAGGFIDVYLLEKSRVTYQQTNERGYHIFYQLLEEGPVPGLREMCLLSDDIYDYFFPSQVNGEEKHCTLLTPVPGLFFLQIRKVSAQSPTLGLAHALSCPCSLHAVDKCMLYMQLCSPTLLFLLAIYILIAEQRCSHSL